MCKLVWLKADEREGFAWPRLLVSLQAASSDFT